MPAANPTFMYGPKDGAKVPDMLWVLDVITLREKDDDGTIWLHSYVLNSDNKNYYYAGVTEGGGDTDE